MESSLPAVRVSRSTHVARGVMLAGLCLAAASNVAPKRSDARPDLRPPLAAVPARLVPTRKLVESMSGRSLLEISVPTALAINEARPIAPGGVETAPPFRFSGDAASRARAIDCLAAAAWYEAGDDPVGAGSVVQVVLNRARHPAYRSSICGVVFQGSERETGCQFTFTCDGALARVPSPVAWARARKLANAALDGAVFADVGAATHYHTDWVVPFWGPRLDKIAKVRTHIFFRFPGSYGRRRVLGSPASLVEPLVPQLARLSEAHLGGQSGAVPSAAESAGLVLPSDRSTPAALGARAGHGAIRMELAGMEQPGRWAVKALGLCGPAGPCLVIGDLPGSGAGAKPLFVFARDASGMALPLWDCTQVARPDPAQCLPIDRAGLDRLLRGRSVVG